MNTAEQRGRTTDCISAAPLPLGDPKPVEEEEDSFNGGGTRKLEEEEDNSFNWEPVLLILVPLGGETVPLFPFEVLEGEGGGEMAVAAVEEEDRMVAVGTAEEEEERRRKGELLGLLLPVDAGAADDEDTVTVVFPPVGAADEDTVVVVFPPVGVEVTVTL